MHDKIENTVVYVDVAKCLKTSDSMTYQFSASAERLRTTTDNWQRLQRQREGLIAELALIGDFRPGNLNENFHKYGKPCCQCKGEGHPDHGPTYTLTRKRRERTVSRGVPAVAVAQTQAQMREYQRLRTLVDELVDVSDELCHLKAKAANYQCKCKHS